MKTKNFKRTRLLSTCVHSGVSPYGRTEMLAGSPMIREHRELERQGRIDAALQARATRKLDRERQKVEVNLPWTLIGAMLKNNPSLSLVDAKHIASSVTQRGTK